MDIRTKTGLIIHKNGAYLVARQVGTGDLVWSASPWDAWITRSREDAESVMSIIGGELFLFNPVAGQIRKAVFNGCR